MEKNKITLLTIIVLIIIFLPCTIIGVTKHFEEKNKNHDFYFNGSLHFYDNDVLIGTYKCKTTKCSYASYTIADTNEKKETKLINKQYAFIKDGDKIYLEDIKNGWNINKYEELKIYHTPIENDSIITKNKGLWGIVSMSPSLTSHLINKYDDIYFKDAQTNVLTLENIYVKEKEQYKIIKNKEEIFTSLNKIIDNNDQLIITEIAENHYQVVDFNNKTYLGDDNIEKYFLTDKYLAIWTANNLEIYFIDKETELTLNYLQSFNNYSEVKLEDNKLNVYEYDEIIDSFEL